MLRALGALMVLAVSAWWGASARSALQRRVTELEEMGAALGFLEEELAFSLTPLPKLLDTLAATRPGAVGRFFEATGHGLRLAPEEGIRGCWRDAAWTCLGHWGDEARQVLVQLGDTLGRYDAEAQRQALRRAMGRLELLRGKAAQDRDRLGRVYAALGLAGGMLAVIVLL